MTTYAWPTSAPFKPQAAELRVIDNLQRVVESPLSGYVQTQSMPGARWGWAFDMTPHSQADRQALEAYLLRLSGREHRVQLWDLKHPQPAGGIHLSGVTLGATAAQFATSLTLAGCRHRRNLLLGSSFEIDTNVDGLADGWTLFVDGTGDAGRTHTKALVTYSYNVIHGTYAQYVSIAAATNTNGTGIRSDRMPVSASTAYTISGYVYASVNSKARLMVRQFTAGGATTGTDTFSGYADTSGMTRKTISITTAADCATVEVHFRGINTVGEDMRCDALQLEPGTAATDYPGPATLLAGDWLGLATGQLVRVVADATANDSGAMTVSVRHMLRAQAASAGAVTLDRPTALFVRTESGLALPRQAGNAEPGLGLEFVEVFA